MIAMLLVMTTLGLIALLMREYSDVSRFTDAKEKTLDGVQFALAEMAHEVGAAVRMVAPSSGAAVGANTATLEFRRFDPAVERFNLPAEPPEDPMTGEVLPLEWNPRNLAETMLVVYRRDANGELFREVTRASSTFSRQTMCPQVASLSVTKLDGGYLKLTLGFQENLRLRNFTMQTRVWSRP